MTISEQRFNDFLTALGDKRPAPGGGAVAGILAAISASLGEMVVRYSKGKKKLAEFEHLYDAAINALDQIRNATLKLADLDAEAYTRLNQLQKLEADDPVRVAKWDDAVANAVGVPRSCLDLSLNILRICEQLLGKSNQWLQSDLAIAAIAAEAAASAAAWNVRINLPSMSDAAERNRIAQIISKGLEEARRLRSDIEDGCG